MFTPEQDAVIDALAKDFLAMEALLDAQDAYAKTEEATGVLARELPDEHRTVQAYAVLMHEAVKRAGLDPEGRIGSVIDDSAEVAAVLSAMPTAIAAAVAELI